ncbi:MAG: hypothetical protein JNM63_17610 [Spirochaetia bacterium]|nr:hypothetical protein [Spirochaetia bacterium]
MTAFMTFVGFGYSQPRPTVISESEVPEKILTNFKSQFTKEKVKWSRDQVSYEASLETKDAKGQPKISLFIGYDAKTGEAEFMQNALFNPVLLSDMELYRMVVTPIPAFYIMIDMGSRERNSKTFGKFDFLLRSFKAGSDTYILRYTDGEEAVTVTYDDKGKQLKEERKKGR